MWAKEDVIAVDSRLLKHEGRQACTCGDGGECGAADPAPDDHPVEVARSRRTRLLTGTSLGSVATSLGYHTFGEVMSEGATSGGSSVYATALTRDNLGGSPRTPRRSREPRRPTGMLKC
jgi:hypothetical protein